MLDLLISTVVGLQWSCLRSYFLTFRILDIADLFGGGYFPLGACLPPRLSLPDWTASLLLLCLR